MAYCKNCGKETDWLSKSGYCKDCAEQILREREGKPPKAKKPIYKQAWFIVLCVLVAALIINAIAHTGKGTNVYDDIISSFGVAGYIEKTIILSCTRSQTRMQNLSKALRQRLLISL